VTVKLRRTVVVAKPLDVVFNYLADFTTTTEWDPATVRTIRGDGDGGVGTTYRNTSKFLGHEALLDYLVIDLRRDEQIRLRGENKSLVAHDTMTFRRTQDRTEVTYTAEFAPKGLAKLATPLLLPALHKLVREGAAGLQSALDCL
jgi:hypothetical protein